MKLTNKIFLMCLLACSIPLILFSLYLIRDTREYAIDTAQKNDISQLDSFDRQTTDLLYKLNDISKNFALDEDLEQIALKNYDKYIDQARDFLAYDNDKRIRVLNSKYVSSIEFYLENQSLVSNSLFNVINEEIKKQQWYDEIYQSEYPINLSIIPKDNYAKTSLSLTRRINFSGKSMLVVSMEIVEDRLDEIFRSTNSNVYLFRDGKFLLYTNNNDLKLKQKNELISVLNDIDNNSQKFSDTININEEKFLLSKSRLNLPRNMSPIDIVIVSPYNHILRDVNSQTYNFYKMLFFIVVFSLAIISYLTIQIDRQFKDFKNRVEKIAIGKTLEPSTSMVDPNTKNEWGKLYYYLEGIILRMQNMNYDIQNSMVKAEKFQTQKIEAEAKMLRMQINPHFLYNTLESIRMLALKNEQKEIEEIVKNLSKLMHYALASGRTDVTLQEALNVNDYYLSIQKIRYQDRFTFNVEINGELENCLLDPFILQPIIENAMTYAIEELEENGHISVNAYELNDDLVIRIKDNGPGIKPEILYKLNEDLDKSTEDGRHIGLKNVHQRIKYRYGEKYGLKILSEVGVGTEVYILIPKRFEEEK